MSVASSTSSVAIVTGAARGIGRATAIRLAQDGFVAICADVDLPGARETCTQIEAAKHRATAIELDVTQLEQVREVVAKVLADFGRIDVLVNNAGILRDARVQHLEAEDFDAVVGVNLRGVYVCTRAVVPSMIERSFGVILNASSVVGLYGNFGQTNYVAAKAGVIGMTKVWARELGPRGIRVNAVAPGFIDTPMLAKVPAAVAEKLRARIPLGRLGQAQDVANAYAWLASDQAAYVNGHVLSVDGGAVV